MYNFTCTPRVITSYLLSVIGILLTANFFVIHRRIVAPDPVLKGFRAAFYFGAEANFPCLFTALLILACAVILWKMGNIMNSPVRSHNFKMLSAFYLVLAVDDFFNVHRQLIQVADELLQSEFTQSPVTNYFLSGALFLIVILVLITAIRTLPGRLKIRFLIAFLTYVIGSAGKSLLRSSEPVQPQLTDVFIALGQTAGQLLEMTAMLFLLHGLLNFYLSNIQRADIRLTFFPSQPDVLESDKIEDLYLK
jgi:hypothetical protein